MPTAPSPKHSLPSSLDEVLDLFDGLKSTPWKPGHFKARCPAHEDSTPSLGLVLVEERPGRRHLSFTCFAGCTWQDILAALGLKSFQELSFRSRAPPVSCAREQSTIRRSVLSAPQTSPRCRPGLRKPVPNSWAPSAEWMAAPTFKLSAAFQGRLGSLPARPGRLGRPQRSRVPLLPSWPTPGAEVPGDGHQVLLVLADCTAVPLQPGRAEASRCEFLSGRRAGRPVLCHGGR